MKVFLMNKPLIFPLVIMFLISIVLFAATSVAPEADTGDYSDSSGINIDGDNRTVLIPAAESQTVNIWTIGAAIVIIIAAIAIGIVSGIQFLGSGITETSQRYVVVGFIYLGLWACLTVITSTMLFDTLLTTIIWFGLTMIFALGLASELTEGD